MVAITTLNHQLIKKFRGDILKLFYCYSPNLKKYLCNNGLKFLHIGVHQKTKRKFWVFEGNEALNFYLSEWRKGRN